MYRSLLTLSVLTLMIATVAFADLNCRFAELYRTADLFASESLRQEFLLQHASMESFFMKTIGLDQSTQLTRDGNPLDLMTGLANDAPHMFSAPSKESLHVAVLASVLDQNSSISNQTYTISEALTVLEAKVTSMERFHAKYPGFGGFMPWVAYDGEGNVNPTWDWQNRVPSLDNGEFFWAAFAVSHILNRTQYREARPGLAERWFTIWQRMVQNAVKVFFDASTGNFWTVTNILNQSWPVENNTYTGSGALNDPYEGELFVDMVYLLSNDLTSAQKEQLWVNKRGMLQRVALVVQNCNISTGTCRDQNITVQKGFWFSAHEQWKYLMLPYLRSPTNARVFYNGERARTWYATQTKQSPGLWASVNGPIPNNNASFPYFSDCGVGPIAFQPVLHDDVITPYGAFPLFLASPPHATAWFHHMLRTKKGQNCYGTTESFEVNGTMVAPLTTWDSKITTLVATMGGLFEVNAAILESMGLLNVFVEKIESEWALAFAEGIEGEDLPFLLPETTVPAVLDDFTTCSVISPPCSI